MKRFFAIIGIGVVAAVISLGCGKRALDEGTVVSVVYSTDTHGKLEGCGCRKEGGGITRRAARIEAARKEDPTVLYVDAGNFLMDSSEAGASAAEAMVAVYNQLGATAVNVSERELQGGMDAFRKAKEASTFAYVSANIRANGNPVADPYVIRDVKGAKVALVGLCGTKDVMRYDSSRLPAGITIENPLIAAKRVIPEVAGKANIIIVLSTCGDEVDSLLAQTPGYKIDLVVGGRSYRPNAAAPWVFGPGFSHASVGGYADLNERIAAAEENLRSLKAQSARGLVAKDDLAKAQQELDELKREQQGEKGKTRVHNACVVRAQRDGRELGRMDLVFGAKNVIRTFSPTVLKLETSDPSSPDMLALVRKYVPDFADNPASP